MSAREFLSITLAGLAFTMLPFAGSPAAEPEELEMVQSLTFPGGDRVCGVTASHDGRFLYSAAWQANVRIFERDARSGELTLVESLDGEETAGAICIRISADDKYAVVARSNKSKASILARDPATGKLTKTAEVSVPSKRNIDGRSFGVMDACLSSDDRFLYTASGDGLGVYRFADEKLEPVQFEEADGNLKGGRCIVLSPDERWLYVVASLPGTLSVFRRDTSTGKLEAFQMIKNGHDDAPVVRDAFRLALSPNGKQAYVTTGRFGGHQAVSVFSVETDGTLKLVQHLLNGADDFTEFEGGNETAVSPDGTLVVATASASDRLFRFARNPETGILTFIGSQQAGTFHQSGAAGVCFSPDGKFVYVADEAESAIQVYKIP